MPAFNQRIAKALATRRQQGLSRCLRSIDGGNQAQLVFNDSLFTNFSSNDYLGLASDKELSLAWQRGIELYGNGSGASPLVTGFSPAHQNLESALCDWLGYPRAVLFNSGFSANQAMLFSLLEKGDLLLQDKLNHASLMEAGALSPATMKRFLHNDPQSLSKLLTEEALVVTEGVFSMDGDLAPLADLHALCEGQAWLAVDDAHGIGVLGEQGRGSCSHAKVRPDLLVVTFGKAFGLSGAAILCSEEVGNYLTQFARHHVYSTAMPPSQAYALMHAVGMIQRQEWRREKLSELQQCYAEQFSYFPGYTETITPIKPLLVGESEIALSLAEHVKQQGHWLTAIRPPTVPKNTARIRITLTANHTTKQVKALAESLNQAMEKLS